MITENSTLQRSVNNDRKKKALLASLEEELLSTQLGQFLDQDLSTIDNLVFAVFQNEKRNLLYGWGR